MSDFRNALAAGFADAIATLGRSELVFQGKSFAGIAASVSAEYGVDTVGYEEVADMQFDMSRADYDGSNIANRSRVKIDGEAYQVIHIATLRASPVVHLMLKLEQ